MARIVGVWRGYLLGQCSNALKVSLWWTGLSPLVLSLTGSDASIGAVRVAFNLALLFFSPFAGVLAERVRVETILVSTTAVRGALYGAVLPLLWATLFDHTEWLAVLLVLLSFMDGAQVAFANVVDIDMGGADLLGQQRKKVVTDALRNKLNSIWQIVFDSSFFFFTPSVALLAWYISYEAFGKESSDYIKSGILVAVFASIFVLTSLASLYFYTIGMRMEKQQVNGSYSELSGNGEEEEEADRVYIEEDEGAPPDHEPILASLMAGARLTWQTKPVRYRLIFLGLEVAMEDAMVAVVIAEYAYNSRLFGAGDPTATNLYAAVIVAVGKLGAMFAGWYMHSRYILPKTVDDYRPLFISVLVAGASMSLLLLAYRIEMSVNHSDSFMAIISRGLVFVSSAMFFLFSTGPKIGFETLLQGMAASVEGSGKIFGFVGPFISVVDSIVVMGISLAFSLVKAQADEDDTREELFLQSLMITCGVFLLHGVVEAFLGPSLMLPRDETMLHNLGLH